MLVRNWMQTQPVTVSSDTLVSEAKRILGEKNLHALPVVDNGILRGLITRAGCLRAAGHAARTQNPDELDYFVNRLQVKDIMVRNPVTVASHDTIEHCLLTGHTEGLGQLPVVDEDGVVGRVVGVISATEIFKLTAQMLGAFEQWAGITLAPRRIANGTLGDITRVAEGTGAVIHALYPLTNEPRPASGDGPEKRIILRFEHPDPWAVVRAFEEAGYVVTEVNPTVQSKTSRKTQSHPA